MKLRNEKEKYDLLCIFRYILYLLYIIGDEIPMPDSENQLFRISLGERERELIRLIVMVDQLDPHIPNAQRLANYEATGLFVTPPIVC